MAGLRSGDPAAMTELDQLLEALDAVQARGDDSYVLVTVEGRDGLHAEIGVDGDGPGLYAEVVGESDALPEARPSLAETRALREAGWDEVGADLWRREWPRASTPADRRRVALETLRALGEAWGATGAVRVEEVGLGDDAPFDPDGASTPPAAEASRAVVLGVAVALAVLGAAVAVLLAAA